MCSPGSITGKGGVSPFAAARVATLSSRPPRTVSLVEPVALPDGIARFEGINEPDEARAWHGVQSRARALSLPNPAVIA